MIFTLISFIFLYIPHIKEEFFTLYNQILTEKQQIDTQITSLQKQLAAYPPGILFCTKNQDRYKWYHSTGKEQIYIARKNRPLAEKLAEKKYLNGLLQDLMQEKSAIDAYLQLHAASPGQAEKVLNHPEYQNLLSHFFTPLCKELTIWQNTPYERNQKYPERLVYKTVSGDYVRSKSESLIYMMLYTHRIPFRYECALSLGEALFYPDFTIRHPRTGEYYYWEHFGKMDDPSYCKSTFSKLHHYSLYNIIPSVNLITTYETKEHPLNPDVIEKLLQHYFL